MSDLTTRPVRTTDAAAISDLLNAIELAAVGDAGWTEGEVRALMAGWLSSDPADGKVLCARDGSVVAVGMVATPESGTQTDLFGGVHPDWCGRGIGRELLGWQIARITALRDANAPGQTWQVDVGAATTDAAALRLFERFGMRPVRYFSDMRTPTSAATIVEAPTGVRIGPYEPHMFQALYAAHVEAFADHWGFQQTSPEKWAALTVGAEVFRPDLSRLAIATDPDSDGDTENVVAYVLGNDSADNSLYISHVGTRRGWRGRGLASALISEVLVAAAKDGKPQATLAVDADSLTGAVGVYERAGFAVRSQFVDYRREI